MERRKNTSTSFLENTKTTWLKLWRNTKRILHETKVTFLASFAKWVDPKLEKYRSPESRKLTNTKEHRSINSTEKAPASIHPNLQDPGPKNTKNAKTAVTNTKVIDPIDATVDSSSNSQTYTPKTITEFLDVMKRTPRTVLDQRERHVIATIMNFPYAKVSEIMLPPSAITYVNDDEVLGPLVLDRLYKSGYQHFPVIDGRHRIIGLIHTTALNSLEIKKTSHAREILDPKVYYLREDYTLNQALAAFLRTNCYFFLVVDRFERIVGMLTYQMLIDYLLGETPADKFDRDGDRLAVAKRKL